MLRLCLNLFKRPTNGKPPYQKWTNYPDSPVLTKDYPYQVITTKSGVTRLFMCATPFYFSGSALYSYPVPYTPRSSIFSGVWQALGGSQTSGYAISGVTLLYANADVYTDNTFTTVAFGKSI